MPLGQVARVGNDLHGEATMRFLLMLACTTGATIGMAQAFPADDAKPPKPAQAEKSAEKPASYAQVVLHVEGMI